MYKEEFHNCTHQTVLNVNIKLDDMDGAYARSGDENHAKKLRKSEWKGHSEQLVKYFRIILK